MKYIIEVSDDEMEKVKNSHKALFIDVYGMMANIIKNGIPLEEHDNPNSIRINFVGEEEVEEFKQYLENQQEKCRWNEQGMEEWEKLQKEKELLKETGKDINATTTDCISREEAIKCVEKFAVDEEDGSEYWRSRVNEYLLAVENEITNLSSVTPATAWHKVKTRPLTDEEKEVYGEEYNFIYDCEMPDDGQEVLVKTQWGIDKTTYYTDYGCYFESYEDEGAVIAWTELPEWEE